MQNGHKKMNFSVYFNALLKPNCWFIF